MQLSPIIIDSGSFIQFTYVFEFDDSDEETEERLQEFLKKAHNSYYNHYSAQPEISKSVRQVDIESLAGRVLSQYELQPELGRNARFYVTAFSQKVSEEVAKGSPFIMEYLQYTLHHLGENNNDKTMLIFPMGFQTFHSFKHDKTDLISRVIMDLRCSPSEVEASMHYLTDVAIPKLESYLQYTSLVYSETSGRPCTIDNEEVMQALSDEVVRYYESRLNNPMNNRRYILSIDTRFAGSSPETFTISHAFHLRGEETTTPQYQAGHPEYKAVPLEQETVVTQTFRSMG